MANSNAYRIYTEARDRKGVTDYAVSKQTGVSQAILSNWKSGRSVPKADKMIPIARYLGIDPMLLIK